MRSLALLALLGLGGCGGAAAPLPPESSPTAGPPPSPALPVRASCTDAAPHASLEPNATVAVMATGERELTLFVIEDLTGCWVRLDPSEAPLGLRALAVHPSGRFVFASGQALPGRTGVSAYRIVPERAALDGLGGAAMVEHSVDHPGPLVASVDSVYMTSLGPHTGYHGGTWRWSFGTDDGGLTFRGLAAPSSDPFFLEIGPGADVVYLGTEIWEPRYRRSAVAYRIGNGGALTAFSEAEIDAPAAAVMDPSGRFVWLVVGWSQDSSRLQAYRLDESGALGRPEVGEWRRRRPVVHPSGRVLNTASSTEMERTPWIPRPAAPA